MGNFDLSHFPVLSTKRLVLRKPSLDDFSDILEIRSNELVNKYIDREVSITRDEAGDFISKILDGIEKNEWLYWILCRPDQSKLIGTICLWNFMDNPFSAEVGFELLPSYHRLGYMKEALAAVTSFGFENIGLNQIKAFTHAQNEPAIRILEAFHFKFVKREKLLHSILNIPYETNIYCLNNH